MDFEAFVASELVQDGVLLNLEVVSEAAKNIRRDVPDLQINTRTFLGR